MWLYLVGLCFCLHTGNTPSDNRFAVGNDFAQVEVFFALTRRTKILREPFRYHFKVSGDRIEVSIANLGKSKERSFEGRLTFGGSGLETYSLSIAPTLVTLTSNDYDSVMAEVTKWFIASGLDDFDSEATIIQRSPSDWRVMLNQLPRVPGAHLTLKVTKIGEYFRAVRYP